MLPVRGVHANRQTRRTGGRLRGRFGYLSRQNGVLRNHNAVDQSSDFKLGLDDGSNRSNSGDDRLLHRCRKFEARREVQRRLSKRNLTEAGKKKAAENDDGFRAGFGAEVNANVNDRSFLND